jgi:putative ABC transport system permease protein
MIAPSILFAGSRARRALAVAAVAIGVAAVCASGLVNDGVLRAFSAVLAETSTNVALQVTARDRGGFRQTVAFAVEKVPGVASVFPTVTAPAIVSGPRPESVTVRGLDIGPDGVGPLYGDEVRRSLRLDFPLLLRGPEAVVLPRSMAVARGIDIGAGLVLETPVGARPVTVVGIYEAPAAERLLGGRLVFMPLQVAQHWFGSRGYATELDVLVHAGVDTARVEEAIASMLPAALQVERPLARHLDVDGLVASLDLMLGGTAAVGLLLGFLVVVGVVSTELVAGAWQLGVLRGVGLDTRALWGSLLRDGVLLGIAGACLGIPAGILLGWVALPRVAAMAALNYDVVAPSGRLDADAPIVLAAGIGVAAAVLAVAWPARRYLRSPAVAIAGRWGRTPPATAAAPWLSCLGVALSLAAAVGLQHVRTSPVWGLAATMLAMVTVALSARPLVWSLWTPVVRVGLSLFGARALLATSAVAANLRQTTITVALIGIGGGCLVWMRTLAVSFETTLADTLRATIAAELIVTSAQRESNWLPAAMDEEPLAMLERMALVDVVAGNRVRTWGHRGVMIALNAFDPVYFRRPELGRPPLVGASRPGVWDTLARGEGVLVSTNFARTFDLEVDDVLHLDTPSGRLDFPVVGITRAFLSPNGTVELSRAVYQAHWDDARVNRIWVHTASNVEPGVARDAIDRALNGPAGAVQVSSAAEMRAYLTGQVQRAFAPLDVAEGVVLLVVVLAVTNALAASVLRRRHEIGIVRAIGVRASTLARMVMLEGVVLGALGAILGLLGGGGLGAFWVAHTLPDVTGWMLEWRFPHEHAIRLGLLTAVLGAIGAFVPAHRAARVAPMEALRCA